MISANSALIRNAEGLLWYMRCIDLGGRRNMFSRSLPVGMCRSILNVLSLACAKDGVCYIRGSRVPTGISSYPDEYHCASAPDWGT